MKGIGTKQFDTELFKSKAELEQVLKLKQKFENTFQEGRFNRKYYQEF